MNLTNVEAIKYKVIPAVALVSSIGAIMLPGAAEADTTVINRGACNSEQAKSEGDMGHNVTPTTAPLTVDATGAIHFEPSADGGYGCYVQQ